LKKSKSLSEYDNMYIQKQVSEKMLKIESEYEQLLKDNQEMKDLLSKYHSTVEVSRIRDCDLHFAFLFATPLVVNFGGGYNRDGMNFKSNYKPQPLLEFK
jgi:hypothetical protein